MSVTGGSAVSSRKPFSVVALLLLVACTTPASDSPSNATTSPVTATDRPSISPASATATASEPTTVWAGDPPFPLEATIPELQRAMDEGRLTSVALVEMYLARIEAFDDHGPMLNAFIFVNPGARSEAAALDAERARSGPRGPLHGIPVVVKDNIETVDMPTTAGSRAMEGFRPNSDAFQVRRLRDAGAVILGKANLCEFATCWESRSSLGGQTLNPYDLRRDPGGSSGGTAVAVAANLAAVGLGTDTCGSVRVPAAHGDIYGLRPTTGRSSRSGVIPFSPTLDEVGPMARSVTDLAILLDATVGQDPEDPTTVAGDHDYAGAVTPDGLDGTRIGVLPFSAGSPAGNQVQAALDDMAANGAALSDVTLPSNPMRYLFFDEMGPALDAYLAAHPGAPVRTLDQIIGLEPSEERTPRLRELAAAEPDPAVLERQISLRGTWRDAIVAFMDEHHLDAIAYPVTTLTAALVGSPQDHYDCAISAFSGLPTIAVPAGFTSDGLPVGLELLGRPFDEEALIAIAAGFEAHTDHRYLPSSAPPLVP